MIMLTDEEKAIIIQILKEHIQASTIKVFGSRCHGPIKFYSDLDLVICKHDKTPYNWKKLALLQEAFQESVLNFRVDLIDYWKVSESFRQVIDQKHCFFAHFND